MELQENKLLRSHSTTKFAECNFTGAKFDSVFNVTGIKRNTLPEYIPLVRDKEHGSQYYKSLWQMLVGLFRGKNPEVKQQPLEVEEINATKAAEVEIAEIIDPNTARYINPILKRTEKQKYNENGATQANLNKE